MGRLLSVVFLPFAFTALAGLAGCGGPHANREEITGEVKLKDQPVADTVTLEQYAAAPLAQERLVMTLLLSFAGLALVLSTLGIYSVLSYAIAQRTREIGLRMALGAEQGSVLKLVVGGGATLALFGIGAGIAAALALTRLMADLLYGVRGTDPTTFAVVTLILGATSLLACYVPARRAMRVDPMVALRHD